MQYVWKNANYFGEQRLWLLCSLLYLLYFLSKDASDWTLKKFDCMNTKNSSWGKYLSRPSVQGNVSMLLQARTMSSEFSNSVSCFSKVCYKFGRISAYMSFSESMYHFLGKCHTEEKTRTTQSAKILRTASFQQHERVRIEGGISNRELQFLLVTTD